MPMSVWRREDGCGEVAELGFRPRSDCEDCLEVIRHTPGPGWYSTPNIRSYILQNGHAKAKCPVPPSLEFPLLL
jgi:hypothetical protein